MRGGSGGGAWPPEPSLCKAVQWYDRSVAGFGTLHADMLQHRQWLRRLLPSAAAAFATAVAALTAAVAALAAQPATVAAQPAAAVALAAAVAVALSAAAVTLAAAALAAAALALAATAIALATTANRAVVCGARGHGEASRKAPCCAARDPCRGDSPRVLPAARG